MTKDELLAELCWNSLDRKGLRSDSTVKRVTEELNEIAKKKDSEYFVDLYENKLKFSANENNLAVAYLLDLVDGVAWEKGPDYTVPEWPDIDIDYLPEVRGPLKEVFAPKAFGEEKVCNIGSYNTYGLKSALIDMTRVFGGDREEILRITTQLGIKDDEGQVLSWERALEIYSPLKAWVDKNWSVKDEENNSRPGPRKEAQSLIYCEIV